MPVAVDILLKTTGNFSIALRVFDFCAELRCLQWMLTQTVCYFIPVLIYYYIDGGRAYTDAAGQPCFKTFTVNRLLYLREPPDT